MGKKEKNNKSIKKNRSPKAKLSRAERRKIFYYTIFLLGWTAIVMLVSQIVVAFPMVKILGEDFQEPSWTLLFYVLNYGLTIVLLFYLTPKIANLVKNQVNKRANKKVPGLNLPKVDIHEQNEFSLKTDELGVKKWPTFVDVGLAPVGYIIYIFFAQILTSFMQNFSWFNADQSQETGFSYFLNTRERVCAVIAIVFLAPIVEELVMRGWLYGKIRNKLGVVLSILLVSVLFGVLHLQWNVGVSVFVLSIILCSLREITGSIWAGTLLHILSNGIAFYILYIANAGMI